MGELREGLRSIAVKTTFHTLPDCYVLMCRGLQSLSLHSLHPELAIRPIEESVGSSYVNYSYVKLQLHPLSYMNTINSVPWSHGIYYNPVMSCIIYGLRCTTIMHNSAIHRCLNHKNIPKKKCQSRIRTQGFTFNLNRF